MPLLAGCLLVLGAGCKRGGANQQAAPAPESAGAAEAPLNVVAVVRPLADLVMQVGGRHVSVSWLIKGAQEAADFQPSDAQRRLLADADLIITSGYDDPWADRPLSESIREFHVIRPENTAAARAASRRWRPFADGSEESVTPRSGNYPQALWLDPLVAHELIDTVRDRLVTLDSAHADEYRANADGYRAQLEKLLAEYHVSLDIAAVTPASMAADAAASGPSTGPDAPPPPAFLSPMPFWEPLARRVGWREISRVNRPPWALSDADFQVLRRAARDNDIRYFAVSTSWPLGVRENLQDQMHLRLLLLDAMGTTGGGYLPLLRYNLRQLKEAAGTLAAGPGTGRIRELSMILRG